MIQFQVNDISLESQWRAIILFGKNSATYKFAFGKTLLDLVSKEKTQINLEELSMPFVKNILDHLKNCDKQGNSNSSIFLNYCRKFITGDIDENTLLKMTERFGFVNVIDAFQIVNREQIPKTFYVKDFKNGKKNIIITDHLLRLKDSHHFENFFLETEARWKLVETAWNLNLNPKLLEVEYDEGKEIFFIENNLMRRIDLTSARDALNGYQKGKCFYSFKDISLIPNSPNLCQIDHFLPHLNKKAHLPANINAVWNLVLANKEINSISEKGSNIPALKYLNRLFKRNEFYIESKHPLAETIVNQTGNSPEKRKTFLEEHYNIAKQLLIHEWVAKDELPPCF